MHKFATHIKILLEFAILILCKINKELQHELYLYYKPLVDYLPVEPKRMDRSLYALTHACSERSEYFGTARKTLNMIEKLG